MKTKTIIIQTFIFLHTVLCISVHADDSATAAANKFSDIRVVSNIMDTINKTIGGPRVAQSAVNAGKTLMEIPKTGKIGVHIQRALKELFSPGISIATAMRFYVTSIGGRFAIVATGKAGALIGIASIKIGGALALGMAFGVVLAKAGIGQDIGSCLGDMAYENFGPAPEWMYPVDEAINRYILNDWF